MSSPRFVIVSGLPASGKTTLAEPLAQTLGIPLLSKDAIKEGLFETVGYGGLARSKTLSRVADAEMMRMARSLDGAVLDNFWHAETVEQLLAPLPRPIVEVFCHCDPDRAYKRFGERIRHPGHADEERSAGAARTAFFTSAEKLPLQMLGPVVEVDTERPVDVALIAARVVDAFAAAILD